MVRRIAGISLLLTAPIFFVGCSDDDDSNPTNPNNTTQKIEVLSGQTPDNGQLVISRVVANQDGWIVIHRDNANQPVVPAIIGKVQVTKGTSTDVKIILDSAVANGERLWAMLHEDTGVKGLYEFSGSTSPDQPISVNGTMVMTPFSIQQTDPMVSVENQTLNNNQVVIKQVNAAEDGWIVVHASNSGGTFAQVIGKTHVNAGMNMNVIVSLDMLPENVVRNSDVLWAMLHYDRGVEGTYEFPGVDAPVVINGDMVMESFIINAATDPTVVINNQSISDNKVNISLVSATEPGWVVLYQDDGTGNGPNTLEPVGRARVSIGSSSDVKITLEQTGISAGTKLWVMLHYDRGTIGTYQFPGVDEPVRKGLLMNEIVMDDFIIQ
jgi:hypothetical protein